MQANHFYSIHSGQTSMSWTVFRCNSDDTWYLNVLLCLMTMAHWSTIASNTENSIWFCNWIASVLLAQDFPMVIPKQWSISSNLTWQDSISPAIWNCHIIACMNRLKCLKTQKKIVMIGMWLFFFLLSVVIYAYSLKKSDWLEIDTVKKSKANVLC